MAPDKLRRDVLDAKEETHIAIQEGMSHKQQASKLEVELEGAHEQERMLTDQVHSHLLIADSRKYTSGFGGMHSECRALQRLHLDFKNQE